MRLLYLGDVVGRTGRDAVQEHVPRLRQDLKLDAVVVNGENAAHGFGLNVRITQDLLESGVDVITLGNHAWDQREMLSYIDKQPKLVRPANYPPGTPGRGATLHVTERGKKLLVIQVMGRLFMDPLDDPFTALQTEFERSRMGAAVDAILVDVHAEATSEKMAIGHFCDGRATLVVGSHTHVPTADHAILPGGTAYQSDAGMCGDYDSVIGMKKDGAVGKLVRKIPGERLQPAEGPATVCGVFVESDDRSGLATRIEPVRIGGRLSQIMPER